VKVASTARLELREGEDGDAAFIVELLNDPDFLRFIGDRGVRNEVDARGYLARLRESYANHGFGLYVVFAGEERVGLCGLVRRDSLAHPDLGFAFLPKARGLGYAREAAEATLRQADALGIEPLLAICSQDNGPSRRLLARVGFQFRRLVRLGSDVEELCLYERG